MGNCDGCSPRPDQAGVDALVEVHDELELKRALAIGATIVGVNNRNLKTLAVDVEAAQRLAPLMPGGVVRVAESGLRTGADVRTLSAVGYDAFLIGERFMTTERPRRRAQWPHRRSVHSCVYGNGTARSVR